MQLSQAKLLAHYVYTELSPACERFMVCGSIRREQPEVKDIDIVVIPKTEPTKDMFDNITGHQPIKEFIDAVNQWPKIKGEPTGKYTQRMLPKEIKLEISIARKENWGYIVAIRTGSLEQELFHILGLEYVEPQNRH